MAGPGYTGGMTATPLGGTATEVLPFPDGSVLTVVTDLATGRRTGWLDGTALAGGEDGTPAPGRALVAEEAIGVLLRRWQDGHPPHDPPRDGTAARQQAADGQRGERMARIRALAFRGARPGPRR